MRKCTGLIDSFCNAASRRAIIPCSGSTLSRHQRQYATETAQYPRRVAVLGGGITGLATAYYIRQQLPHVGVTLFEAGHELGGWLQSNVVMDGDRMVLFESGPRSLRTAGNGVLAMRLVQELGLKSSTIFTPKTSTAATHRYLYYPDRLVRMPHPSFGIFENVRSILTEPIFKGIFASIYNDLRRGPRDENIKDESIGDFFRRRCRPELVDNILSGVIHGIYAGDVEKLSVRSLFPRQWHDDASGAGLLIGGAQNAQMGMLMRSDDAAFFQEMQKLDNMEPELFKLFSDCSVFTFTDGMRALPDALATQLRQDSAVEIRTGCAVNRVSNEDSHLPIRVHTEGPGEPSEAFSEVVCTLSPAHLRKLCSSAGIAHDSPAWNVPSVSVMTVNLLYDTDQILPPGPGPNQAAFGYLIPRATPFEQNPERALGVVFDHAYSPPWTKLKNDDPTSFYKSQDRLPNGGTKITVMLGGHWWDGWPVYPDEEEGLQLAKAVVARHLNITAEPALWRVNMQRDCIPQYTVGHQRRLQDLHRMLGNAFHGKLRVAGNWISGVGVNDCLRTAYDQSRALERPGKSFTGLEYAVKDNWVRVRTEPRD